VGKLKCVIVARNVLTVITNASHYKCESLEEKAVFISRSAAGNFIAVAIGAQTILPAIMFIAFRRRLSLCDRHFSLHTLRLKFITRGFWNSRFIKIQKLKLTLSLSLSLTYMHAHLFIQLNYTTFISINSI